MASLFLKVVSNSTLVSKAGKLRHIGSSPEEIETTLLRMNDELCQPPLPETSQDDCGIGWKLQSWRRVETGFDWRETAGHDSGDKT